MHIDDAAERKLMSIIAQYKMQGQKAWRLGAPCSSFARDSWNTATGEDLNSNILGGLGTVSNPETLKESIIKANGGAITGILTSPGGGASNGTSSGSIGRSSGSSLNSLESSL
jgi:hypothetical protein